MQEEEEGKKKKRLMAFLIPWYSHKKKPKMSSSLKRISSQL